MDRMLNISDRTNAVLHTLALVARADYPVSAKSAAERLGVSPSYLAKALQPLSRSGILLSTRGPAGGFVLARPAESINCLEIMELLDGTLVAKDCLFDRAVCERGVCALSLLCGRVREDVFAVLRRTSIAELARSF